MRIGHNVQFMNDTGINIKSLQILILLNVLSNSIEPSEKYSYIQH
jgi:hypothetical protein